SFQRGPVRGTIALMRYALPLVTLGLSALLAGSTAFANDYVNDPLTDPGFPGRLGFKGGSFGPNGWTITGADDAVWYEIGDALESGSLHFTATGLSLATSLSGGDNDIFALYQAPPGLGEPINYSPYYRNNDFKVFLRIFGGLSGNVSGAF